MTSQAQSASPLPEVRGIVFLGFPLHAAGKPSAERATHLFDEILAGDDLVVLHQGKVLAQGPMSRVVAEAGAQDVNTAFMRLTGAQVLPGGGA